MRVDLHNHTAYCNHASGSMESYLQKASDIGIDIFGFSCHAPMNFDTKYRMSFEQLPLYFSEIPSTYNGMEVLRALEVDYILGREDLLNEAVLRADVDYLIGSIHFLGDWGFDNPEFIGEWRNRGVFATWEAYFNSLQSMIKTGSFQIVGHFDLPKLFGNLMPESLFEKMEDTLKLMRDMDMVLEVNSAGLRKHIKEQYPSLNILKKAKDFGLDVTLCSDAHSVLDIGFGYSLCVDILKDVGFNRVAIFRKKQKYLVEL